MTGFSYKKLLLSESRYARIRTRSLGNGNMYHRSKGILMKNLSVFGSMGHFKYDTNSYNKVLFLCDLFTDRAYIVNLGDLLERWSNGLFK